MITIRIFRDKHQNIVKYQISGHSGYAEIGSDIVCAAVSAVSQSSVLGLMEVLKLSIGLEMKKMKSHILNAYCWIVDENIREKLMCY